MSNEDINIITRDYDIKKLSTRNIPLTKYERTRVLGERASQIENGSTILISNPERFNNSYSIAEEELKQRKSNWQAPELKAKRGVLYKYARTVSSASQGCVTDKF